MAEPMQLKFEFMELQKISQNNTTFEQSPESSRINQILHGIIKGTGLVHALPSSIAFRRENSGLNIQESRLEKLSAGVTALAESATYLVLVRNGIPVYYVPIVTNAVDSVGLGLYYMSMNAMLDRIDETMHHMING